MPNNIKNSLSSKINSSCCLWETASIILSSTNNGNQWKFKYYSSLKYKIGLIDQSTSVNKNNIGSCTYGKTIPKDHASSSNCRNREEGLYDLINKLISLEISLNLDTLHWISGISKVNTNCCKRFIIIFEDRQAG